MGYVPTLVKNKYYRKPKHMVWPGSLLLPESAGGHGQSSGQPAFNKLSPAGWMFNVKFANDDSRVNNIIRIGTNGSDGYKIVKEKRIGQNVITFQEIKAYSAAVRYYPRDFDVTQFHHVTVTWVPASASSVTIYIYINGILLTRVNANITWSNAVNNDSPTIIFGSDYFAETLSGHINDIAYFNQRIYPDDIFMAKNHRIFRNASHLWECGERQGDVLYDSIGDKHLTLYNSAELTDINQGW